MSCTRSMSAVSRTPSLCSKSSSARAATTRRAATSNGSSGSSGTSRAFAMDASAYGQFKADAFAQATAADLERPAEPARRGGEQVQPAGQQAHSLHVEAVTGGHGLRGPLVQ